MLRGAEACDTGFDDTLVRPNADARHENAGFRYADERAGAPDGTEPGVADGDLDRVFRANFTSTTTLRPQTHTLTLGAFRAWNGPAERHEYDLVRVRAAPTHNRSEAANDRLAELEASYLETGAVAVESNESVEAGPTVSTER